jgi:restriction system protein
LDDINSAKFVAIATVGSDAELKGDGLVDKVWFVALALVLVSFASILKGSRFKGAMGERRVKHALLGLTKQGYHLINDVTLPTARGTTQVDHVLLSPFGVFVIETKNMSGWIFGSASQPKWTQLIGRRKYQFQNPLRQNYAHVKAIEKLLDVPVTTIHSLVAFTGEAKAKTAMPDNVFFSSAALLARIKSNSAELFSADEVTSQVGILKQCSLPDTRATRSAHIKQLKRRHSSTIPSSLSLFPASSGPPERDASIPGDGPLQRGHPNSIHDSFEPRLRQESRRQAHASRVATKITSFRRP